LNDDRETMQRTAGFLNECPGISQVNLLPFNAFAPGQRAARERDDERVVAAQHDIDDRNLEQRRPRFGIAEDRQHEHSTDEA
jgi:hypothetical protein